MRFEPPMLSPREQAGHSECPSLQKRSSFLQRVDERVNAMLSGSPQAERGGPPPLHPGLDGACPPRPPGTARLDHGESLHSGSDLQSSAITDIENGSCKQSLANKRVAGLLARGTLTHGRAPPAALPIEIPPPAEMLGIASASAARAAVGLISGDASTSHAPRTGGSWSKDPKRLPPAAPLPPPSGAATAASVAAKAKIDEAKRERSVRKSRESRESKEAGGKEGEQPLRMESRSHRKSKEPTAAKGKDRDPDPWLGGERASVTKPMPLSKVPKIGSLRDMSGVLEAAPRNADGSSMMVPALQFEHGRAEDAAKQQADASGLALLMHTPDSCPLPAVFLFFSGDGVFYDCPSGWLRDCLFIDRRAPHIFSVLPSRVLLAFACHPLATRLPPACHPLATRLPSDSHLAAI